MLILALFFAIYLIAWRIYEKEEKVFNITTFITVIGIINVPIIKYSVEWWSTLHQPASIKFLGTTTIHSSMLLPLFLMLLIILKNCELIFLIKYKTEIIKIKKKNLDRL